MSAVAEVVADLTAESDALDDLVAGLKPAQWATPTPAAGWTIAHQIGHLLWTDRVSHIAITDPDVGFQELMGQAMADPLGFVDKGAAAEAARPPAELLADWRETRAKLAGALCAVPAGTKLPWFGPPMSATSMATARMMETWAHGLDVADALGVHLEPTDRIRNVAHIGVRTRDFAYTVNGKQAPDEPFRYELKSPAGDDEWTWGPDDATNVVRGSAYDFCQLVTQRRHPADLDITTVGDDAAEWVTIAQCFAGPPGGGREPSTDK
ncbi:MAG: TIGR03084 family metal-binding protein [Gordonia sp. (in: high G+C Gram-positive bacteria)]|uniref:TIGR03084 family metal-binding protein n=1 Tax=Gordonia sp. (in: high G+C Gram-positive bacteria) TaxID=84139 RepID=UPI0039E289CE